MPAVGESASVPDLIELVNHAHVVEVLDALTRGPITYTDLRAQVHARQRALVAALRLIGARGLVTRTDNGSWDTDPPDDVVYRYTDLGWVVVEALSCYSLWTAMYDRADAATGHSWKR
jgi:DNA-binding HxlR family transcriptional regulator